MNPCGSSDIVVSVAIMPSQTPEFAELDREIFSRLKRLGYEPESIYDVGASNGYWSVHIANVFPNASFQLFEPLIDRVFAYDSTMSQNLQQHPTFRLHKLALGQRTGEIVINVTTEPTASSILDFDRSVLNATPIAVPVMTLDDCIREYRLPPPGIVKVDVQGAELDVLIGACSTLPFVDVLLLECWLWRGYGDGTPLLTEIISWVAEYGFCLWDVADAYRDADGVLTSLDCAFVNSNTMARYLGYRIGRPRHTTADPTTMSASTKA